MRSRQTTTDLLDAESLKMQDHQPDVARNKEQDAPNAQLAYVTSDNNLICKSVENDNLRSDEGVSLNLVPQATSDEHAAAGSDNNVGTFLNAKQGDGHKVHASQGKLWRQWTVLCHLMSFSILGTLARLTLQWLTFYPGAPTITGVLWANFAGSLMMGLLAEDRVLFRGCILKDIKARPSRGEVRTFQLAPFVTPLSSSQVAELKASRKLLPLYIGLTTGFCGSLTSFSSFIRDVFLAMSNDLPAPYYHATPFKHAVHASGPSVSREGGYSFMALLAVIILTVSLSLVGLRFGASIALLLEHVFSRTRFPTIQWALPILDYLQLLLGPGMWLAAIFMTIWPPDRPTGPARKQTWARESWRGQALFACIFTPLGCIARYYTSLLLNDLRPTFPLGTFTVNMFGTAVLGMSWDLQRAQVAGAAYIASRAGCQIFQGVEDGFCGALTTVSTWVTELNGLRRRHAWIYGSASIIVGTCLLVAIMGPVRWTVGFTAPACVTQFE